MLKLFVINYYFYVFGVDSNSDFAVLNLSKQCLKKVPKTDEAHSVKTLILDDNELQKIDNIDSYSKIEKVFSNVLCLYNIYLCS